MAASDFRIPVHLAAADDFADEAATLIEGEHFTAKQDHPAGCACCGARNSAGRALAKLLQDRARGKVAFFRSVTVVTRTPAGRAIVLEALQTDPVASACYKLGERGVAF